MPLLLLIQTNPVSYAPPRLLQPTYTRIQPQLLLQSPVFRESQSHTSTSFSSSSCCTIITKVMEQLPDSAMSAEQSTAVAASQPERQHDNETEERSLHQRVARKAMPPIGKYCDTGIQTKPPSNAAEFRKIYGRNPTEHELRTKCGLAALGSFPPPPATNPYEDTVGTVYSFIRTEIHECVYSDSSF